MLRCGDLVDILVFIFAWMLAVWSAHRLASWLFADDRSGFGEAS